MGYAHEGMEDTLPPDAGFRFSPDSDVKKITGIIEEYLQSPDLQERFHINSKKWSELVTWERCVSEWEQLLTNGAVKDPVQPWKGLKEPN